MTIAPVLLWFRHDLRLRDHRALAAAIATGRPVIPVYVLDDETPGNWRPSGASRWWLHGSLHALNQDLLTLGSRLTLKRGSTVEQLKRLMAETGADTVYATRDYEPWARRLEQDVASCFEEQGLVFKRFAGRLLFEPETPKTKAGEPFKVFTPFFKACLALGSPKPPLSRPDHPITTPETWPLSDSLDDWEFLPSQPDWAGGLRTSWRPGEAGAIARLDAFMDEALSDYHERRNRPDRPGTSRLSPHLHFGEISPHYCWQAVETRLSRESHAERGGRSFLRELIWREFSYHLLFHWPDLPSKAFRPEFEAFPWQHDNAALRAWQRGRTGYPIVDAGMRELWQTGWMHNRVRMIVASFLIKDLLIPWQEGEAWFWDTLVDADLANNAASWQWVAGSGADAAPYFRVFNPVLQGKKFDPKGEYVRAYLPELRELPLDYLHAPWEAPKEVLADANITLGDTYPSPIVDHGAARQCALEAYETVKAR